MTALPPPPSPEAQSRAGAEALDATVNRGSFSCSAKRLPHNTEASLLHLQSAPHRKMLSVDDEAPQPQIPRSQLSTSFAHVGQGVGVEGALHLISYAAQLGAAVEN